MTELLIRRAEDGDWPVIRPIFTQVVGAADTYAYPGDLSSAAARELWFGQPPTEVWLAEVSGVVVGTYHLAPNHGGPGAHIANGSYMVAAEHRGHGAGRKLVEHSIDRAREIGYRGLQFNAVVETNESAVRLYLALGFTVIGRVPGGFRHPERGFVDLLIMFLPL